MPTLAAPLDCAKLEIRNERVHQLSTAPSTPVSGQLYFNTTDHTLYWYDDNLAAFVSARSGTGGPPSGAAGGDLAGSTYPNPVIAALAVTDAKVATANKDGAAATPGMRTLGTGAAQACAGNDSRLSDSRTPIAHRLTHEPGGSDPMSVDAGSATGSLRTLGLTGNKAMPGTAGLDTIAGANAATTNITASTQKIINLGAPVSASDAATKGYVDAVAQALDVKASCRVASIGNLSVSSPGATIDGVTMVVNDRVLLKNQTIPSENGIYVWNGAATPMTRATDADAASGEVTAGMFTFITEGTANADSGWILTTDDPITVGSTGLVFTQFSGAGQINAGAGLTKTGNTIDVVGTAGRISVAADSIDIDATYVGQASITTVGTIGTGTWNATTIPINKGGTGATTATNARINLGVPYYYSTATHSSGTSFTIAGTTYGGTGRGAFVQCQIEATGAVILPDIAVASNGDVTVTFGVSQSANTIRTTIIGLNSGSPPA